MAARDFHLQLNGFTLDFEEVEFVINEATKGSYGYLKDVRTITFRNSPPEMFCKKDILKFFWKTRRKTPAL